jgi:hypothetical protein
MCETGFSNLLQAQRHKAKNLCRELFILSRGFHFILILLVMR